MAIEFNCPHCGVLYKLDEKFAGKTGKCRNAKCQKPILIPYQSTTDTAKKEPAKPIDAEALAAAAFAEEKPAAEANGQVGTEAAPPKKIAVTCSFCDHKFEVDAGMAGKNTTCPECRKIIRVPKPVEQKAADWRTGNNNRPSLAKVDEPAPAGVWDVQRKGVSGEAIRKAGADEIEEPEEPGERRLRRIKQALYGLALTGLVVFVVMFIRRNIGERRTERYMDTALQEVEKATKKPDLRACIHRYAGEYTARDATSDTEIQQAVTHFNKSRDALQGMAPSSDDRNGLLVELGVALPVLGGESDQINDGKRLPWEQVHPLIRKCLDKLPPQQTELRRRAFELLTRKLAERDQGPLAAVVARNSSSEAEQPELVGRVGIELFLLGKKEQADQVLAKLTSGPQASVKQPAATALYLATHGDLQRPPSTVPHVPPPGLKGLSRESRLAYAEGRALQGKFDEALQIAKFPGSRTEQLEALVRIASAANVLGKADVAASIAEDIAKMVAEKSKGPGPDPWLYVTAAEQAAKAGKMDAAKAIVDAIVQDDVQAWAKLAVLRVKLAADPKSKADETWLDVPVDAENPTAAQAVAQAECARHNAAARESAYARLMQSLKGPLRLFGLAGTALGNQDRDKPPK